MRTYVVRGTIIYITDGGIANQPAPFSGCYWAAIGSGRVWESVVENGTTLWMKRARLPFFIRIVVSLAERRWI